MKLSAYFKITKTNANQLSKNINMSPGYVYEIIKGIKKPSFKFMMRVQEATQGAVTPVDLVDEYEKLQNQVINKQEKIGTHDTRTKKKA